MRSERTRSQTADFFKKKAARMHVQYATLTVLRLVSLPLSADYDSYVIATAVTKCGVDKRVHNLLRSAVFSEHARDLVSGDQVGQSVCAEQQRVTRIKGKGTPINFYFLLISQ